MKKGLQLAIDGVKPEDIRNTLELELKMTAKIHKIGSEIFYSAGGTAPTIGIVGTGLSEYEKLEKVKKKVDKYLKEVLFLIASVLP
jgi:flagellar motor component MotA